MRTSFFTNTLRAQKEGGGREGKAFAHARTHRCMRARTHTHTHTHMHMHAAQGITHANAHSRACTRPPNRSYTHTLQGCQKCGKDNRPEEIVLCDSCDAEFHRLCLDDKIRPIKLSLQDPNTKVTVLTNSHQLLFCFLCMCLIAEALSVNTMWCVCVCVCERERASESERERVKAWGRGGGRMYTHAYR